jgi:type 1 glutamine amidotransferase
MKTLLFVGGTWHDFDGFAGWLSALLGEDGYTVETVRDLERQKRIEAEAPSLVVDYTCLSETREDGSPAVQRMTDENANALATWVQKGGALLALHAATVTAQSSPVFRRLVGGVFVEHPPAFAFTVYPLYGSHPITAGIQSFSVHDELYIARTEPDVQVHLVACPESTAYPLAWSRSEGQGRVAYLALGHDRRVWELPAYGKLVRQMVTWLQNRS